VRDALAALPVQTENRAGYERSKFKHWTDADHDSCNTRMEVLKTEAVTTPAQGPNCTLTGGSWYSPYDDRYLDSTSKLDVDHLVPLAEAWDSGASQWTAKERELYANDLDDARDLIAVSAASNRSKADKDPTEWLPPYAGYQCQYDTSAIPAVFVLTDGRNETAGGPAREGLLNTIGDPNKDPVRVFTIDYGADADTTALQQIADATHAHAYQASNPDTINNVLTNVISNF